MPIARRTFLAVSAQLLAVDSMRGEAGAGDLKLEYHGGILRWPGGAARAVAGRSGVHAHKKEGDGASPAGTFPLVSGFYRADRMARPATRLPLYALSPSDAWVDDPADRNYNRRVALPYPAHAESMWLDDPLYDLLVVIGYNTAPVVPGAGSAIFLHVARPDFAPTAGCIAVEKPVLLRLMPLLGRSSAIAIEA